MLTLIISASILVLFLGWYFIGVDLWKIYKDEMAAIRRDKLYH